MDGRRPFSVFLSSFELLDFPFGTDGRREVSFGVLDPLEINELLDFPFEMDGRRDLDPLPINELLDFPFEMDGRREDSFGLVDPLEINDFLEDALVANILLEGELLNSSSSAADASAANPLPANENEINSLNFS
jgi:hypothetical protein